MSLFKPCAALLLVAALAATLPGAAGAQGVDGAAPAGARTARGGGTRRMSPDAKLPASRMQAVPKPSAAERAEQKKLEHDLHICIGC